jgi:tetratricopeptide (TPR) repeat protein
MYRPCALWFATLSLLVVPAARARAGEPPAASPLARARAHLGKAEYAQAITTASAALKRAPRDARALAVRAEAYARRALDWGNLADARRARDDCKQALALDKTLAQALWARGLARALERDLDRALADCEEAVRKAPRSAEARRARGRVRELRHEEKEALADYAEAVRLSPKAVPYPATSTAPACWPGSSTSTGPWPTVTGP